MTPRDLGTLRARLRSVPGYAALRFAYRLVRSREFREAVRIRLSRPDNLFQPYGTTSDDRYPRIFRFVRDELGDRPDVRLLSFGCSTGEEVFSLRRYFPQAAITGIDVNARHIAACRERLRRSGDARVSFERAGTAGHVATASCDAIFCMAVFRHGDLHSPVAHRCDHRIRFEAFERTLGDLARCLRPGGLLAIRHSNFRFRDTAVAADFDVVLSVGDGRPDPGTPLYGRDDRLLPGLGYNDAVFRKRISPPLPAP